MSASREKKARQERGADYVSPQQQKARKAEKDAIRSTLIFTVCAALFVLCVAAMLVWNSGSIQRNAAAVRINGQDYSAADVSYYYATSRSNVMSIVAGGQDPGGSLRKMEYADGQTYFDLVLDSALSNMASTLAAAQAAKADGLDFTEDYQATVSDTMSSLKTYASNNGYSVTQYLRAIYGALMTRDVYENNLRLAALAQAYSDSISAPSNYSEAELIAKRDESPEQYDTVAIRHILVDDEETANSVLAQWEAGDKTEDSFAALADENSTDPGSNTNGGLYTGVTQGMMVTEFNDWCFDSARKPGDTGIVQTSYGYHVMYFVSRGLPENWQDTAAQAIAAEKLAALSEGAQIDQLPGMKYVDR